MRRPVRTAFLLGILVGLVIAVVRALKGEGSSPSAVAAGSPSLPRSARPVPASTPATSAAPVAPAPSASPAPEPPADVVPPVEADPTPDPPATAAPAAGTEGSDSWVAPVGGECPGGYPVKAKEASKIFHVPEGAFYERTQPDRCYRTGADAEVDGFRASKR